MLDDLPEELKPVLRRIARSAAAFGAPVYLVGGAVRDRLLGRPILDVDLAVEGDAAALARAAGGGPEVEVRLHERFGTAVLRSPSGRRIDLARTRSERYAGVAALPRVRPATLAEDLVRRDFTVNSMAMPLAGEEPELIDPTGGRRDLEARLLRVHHERSFLDDPTRILRGVRFEARLGLAFEPETERLARAASAAGALEKLSDDRLRVELELLFEERIDPGAAWVRLDRLGVVAALGLGPGAATGSLLRRVGSVLDARADRNGGEHRVARSEALLAALVLGASPDRRGAFVDRLCPACRGLEDFERLLASLEDPGLPPHEAAAALERLAPAELVLVEAVGGPGAAARSARYLEEQRGLELSIDGSMLLARGFAPGPEIGAALRATRDARLDGLITAGEELDFALSVLRRGPGGP